MSLITNPLSAIKGSNSSVNPASPANPVYDSDRQLNNLRKRVMYVFSVVGFVGNGVYTVIGLLQGLFNGANGPFRLINNLVILAMWVILFFLTRAGRLQIAGFIFGGVALAAVSFSYALGGTTEFVRLLYFAVIGICAIFLAPLTAFLFGIICMLVYLGISIVKISQLNNPPVELGLETALFSIILLALAGILYGFSSSLFRLGNSSRTQTNELRRLNNVLQRQRQEDIQIARNIAELGSSLNNFFQMQAAANAEQSSLVSSVATTSQELEAAARQIADNAISVATVADRAQRGVENGQQVALQGVSSIAAMRERVQDISTNMLTLNRQLERISEVITIIGEIADETTLLSLNATIEAAGAGEYGRRFAAVADEVQRLARRSTAAVEQIQELVAEINRASGRTYYATEQGLKESAVGDRLVGSLTVANDDVITLVNQTSDLAANIAGATQQQREASAQIVSVMQTIHEASAHLVADTGEVNRTLDSLNQACEQLLRTNRSQNNKSEADNTQPRKKIMFGVDVNDPRNGRVPAKPGARRK